MPRRIARPDTARENDLEALTLACGRALWVASKTRLAVISLDGLIKLGIRVRRSRNRSCPRLGVPSRPEGGGAGRLAAPRVRPRRHRPHR